VDWSKVENGNDKNYHRVNEEIDPVHDNKKTNTDILIIDTGGGTTSTITKQVCMVLSTTNHVTSLSGYQDKATPKQYPIVHCAVKAHIQNYDTPVVFLLNYVTLLDDANENESLLKPFACMRHGVSMDLTPVKHGGEGGMNVEGQFFPFEYDDEKLYFKIEKPTIEDLDYYNCFELTSPLDDTILDNVCSRRNKKKLTHQDIPIVELQRRLGMLPEEVIQEIHLITAKAVSQV
jgi:hypothetical protein